MTENLQARIDNLYARAAIHEDSRDKYKSFGQEGKARYSQRQIDSIMREIRKLQSKLATA